MLTRHVELGNLILSPEQEADYDRICMLVRPFATLHGYVTDREMTRFGAPKTDSQVEWEKKKQNRL